jgi:hypothetical protein
MEMNKQPKWLETVLLDGRQAIVSLVGSTGPPWWCRVAFLDAPNDPWVWRWVGARIQDRT